MVSHQPMISCLNRSNSHANSRKMGVSLNLNRFMKKLRNMRVTAYRRVPFAKKCYPRFFMLLISVKTALV